MEREPRGFRSSPLGTKLIFLLLGVNVLSPICLVYSAPILKSGSSITEMMDGGKVADGAVDFTRAGQDFAGVADASGSSSRISSGADDAAFLTAQRNVRPLAGSESSGPKGFEPVPEAEGVADKAKETKATKTLQELLAEQAAKAKVVKSGAVKEANPVPKSKTEIPEEFSETISKARQDVWRNGEHLPSDTPPGELRSIKFQVSEKLTQSAKALKEAWNSFVQSSIKTLKKFRNSIGRSKSKVAQRPVEIVKAEVDPAALVAQISAKKQGVNRLGSPRSAGDRYKKGKLFESRLDPIQEQRNWFESLRERFEIFQRTLEINRQEKKLAAALPRSIKNFIPTIPE